MGRMRYFLPPSLSLQTERKGGIKFYAPPSFLWETDIHPFFGLWGRRPRSPKIFVEWPRPDIPSPPLPKKEASLLKFCPPSPSPKFLPSSGGDSTGQDAKVFFTLWENVDALGEKFQSLTPVTFLAGNLCAQRVSLASQPSISHTQTHAGGIWWYIAQSKLLHLIESSDMRGESNLRDLITGFDGSDY